MIALLIAVFPATFTWPCIQSFPHVAGGAHPSPVQGVFLALAYWFTGPDRRHLAGMAAG